MGVALGGYDTTGGGAGGARFESVVEGALAGRFSLRVGVEYAPPDAQWSPSVGARVAILRQERFGVDLSMAALYKKAGFSEPDGEIEIIVMLARRWNRFGLFGNLAYGQGLQAAERDGEVRVALLYQLTRRFHLGLDARGRFDLGSKGGGGVDKAFDLIVGPVAGVTVGHFVFLAQAGGRMAVVNENPIGGFTALGGVGAVY
jgi:hypothetical protein